MTTEQMEQRLNAAGFFLRDDRDIREGVEAFAGIEEAYSLHSLPFQRHRVFGGPRTWAVEQAYKFVFPTAQGYEEWVGHEVRKTSKPGTQPHPFKSGSKVNTVKGIIPHPQLPGKPAFTFKEDDSYVACHTCQLAT